MPSDEGRRRKLEAERYRQTEQQKREAAKLESQRKLKGAHRSVGLTGTRKPHD